MHCRFYQDHLVDAYENICNSTTALTRPLAMVKESLQYMNQPIQLLGNVIDRGTTKFSVKGMDSYSIVHISFCVGKCMTTCQDGICSTLHKTHKKIPQRISISNKSKCCSHLNTMYDNIEYVRSFFPSSRSRGGQGGHGPPGPDQQPNFLIEITVLGTIFEKFSASLRLASN